MNNAICISGSIRYPHIGLKSISKILPSNSKIFIHTWNNVKTGRFLRTVHDLHYKEGIKEMIDTDFDLLQYPYEKIKVDDFGETFNELKSLYDSLTFRPFSNVRARNDVGVLSMYYSIYQANKLKCEYEKENDIIFDQVVRMRFDSDIVNDTLDLTKTANFDLCIPDIRFDYTGINDQFAIGSSKTMDTYSNIYKDICGLTDCEYCGEQILQNQLKKNNITPTRIKFPVDKNNNIDFTLYTEL